MAVSKLVDGEQRIYFKAGGEWCYLWTPKAFKVGGKTPVLMHHHGAGGFVREGSADWPDTESKAAFLKAIMTNGIAVAGSHACGNHWGMATPHANLPRGTRIKVGVSGTLKQILFGPADVDDGSQNLVGAITTCMGNVGARSIREFQETEIIIAPSIKTEGKLFQTVQSVGMGTR